MAGKIPLVGRQYLINAGCNGSTAYSAWYLAPYTADYDIVDADTLATFLALATESTAYTAAQRVAVVVDALGSGSSFVNLASPAVFTFNAGATIRGFFITNQPVKSNSTGVILAAAKLTTAKTVVSGESISATGGFALATV